MWKPRSHQTHVGNELRSGVAEPEMARIKQAAPWASGEARRARALEAPRAASTGPALWRHGTRRADQTAPAPEAEYESELSANGAADPWQTFRRPTWVIELEADRRTA
jgi:hypothetical protein